MPSMAASLQPSLAKILSILKVAKESLGGLGPGCVSTPPTIKRILFIEEKMYNQHKKMTSLYILWSKKGVLWL